MTHAKKVCARSLVGTGTQPYREHARESQVPLETRTCPAKQVTSKGSDKTLKLTPKVYSISQKIGGCLSSKYGSWFRQSRIMRQNDTNRTRTLTERMALGKDI